MAVTVMGKDSSPTPQRQVRSKMRMSMFDSYPLYKPLILAIGCLAVENQEHRLKVSALSLEGRLVAEHTKIRLGTRVMTRRGHRPAPLPE